MVFFILINSVVTAGYWLEVRTNTQPVCSVRSFCLISNLFFVSGCFQAAMIKSRSISKVKQSFQNSVSRLESTLVDLL